MVGEGGGGGGEAWLVGKGGIVQGEVGSVVV